MYCLLDPHAKLEECLMFATNGAKVLDFYHAMENLGEFAKVHFEDKLQAAWRAK